MSREADLAPEACDLLETMAERDAPDLRDLSPRAAREFFSEWRSEPEDVPDLAAVEDRTVPGYDEGTGLDVRVYTPEGTGPFPTLVYFHGGGWVVGSLDTVDGICRVLADEADCVVVSVDYRRAPEQPFPAALEDAVAATEWAADAAGSDGDSDRDAVDLSADGRLAVGGDSAGGNLAAAVSLWARDADGPDVDQQTLIYPVIAPGGDWPSYESNGEGYYLERADVDWFREHYWRGDLELANPYACPIEACSHADLPPATVVTCGFDPLRDEGIAYAEALADAGVAVEHLHYPSLIHGVAGMLGDPGLDAARDVLADTAAALRAGLDGGSEAAAEPGPDA